MRIYYLPGSAAMAPHAALYEAGRPFEAVRVIRDEHGRTVEPPDYGSINPLGRVPALVDGDLVLWESAACLLHVADRAGTPMLPPVGSAQRSIALRWLMYLTNTVQPAMNVWFHPDDLGGDDRFQAGVREGVARVAGRAFDWIDGELAGRDYLLGDTFSAPDLFLFMLARWGRHLAPRAFDRPHLGAHYARLAERPSVRAMLDEQGVAAYPGDA